MMENKKELPAGQAESSKGCADARTEGKKEYISPSLELYHKNDQLSIPDIKNNLPIYFGVGISEATCYRCGKTFIPTKPEYAWKDCCSYTCYLHRDDGKVVNERSRPCAMYNSTGDVLIETFKSADDAASYVGIQQAKNIRDCCNGKTRTSGGYVWKWIEEKGE